MSILLSSLTLVQIIARGDRLVDAQGLPESLLVLADPLGLLGKASVRAFHVRVPPSAVRIVLYRLRVDVRLLHALIVLLML